MTAIHMPLLPKSDPAGLTTDGYLRSAWFVAMLAVIDRTIVARRLIFSDGVSELALDVVRKRMRLASGASEPNGKELSLSETAAQLTAFCEAAGPVSYGLRAMSVPCSDGYSISELVNAQSRSSSLKEALEEPHRNDRLHSFSFDRENWPLSMPADATAQSLIAAWRANIWMQAWAKRAESVLGGNILVVATPAERSYRLSCQLSRNGSEVKVIGTESLGQVISEWRSKPRTN